MRISPGNATVEAATVTCAVFVTAALQLPGRKSSSIVEPPSTFNKIEGQSNVMVKNRMRVCVRDVNCSERGFPGYRVVKFNEVRLASFSSR
jgi:hypothetical protein